MTLFYYFNCSISLSVFFCLKLVIDDSLCTLYKHVAMLFYFIFFLWGEGRGWGGKESRKKRYLTKRGVSNQALFEFDDIGWR